jgi:hypothetical protein
MITRIEEGFRALLKSTEDSVLNQFLTPLDSWLVRFSPLHRQSLVILSSCVLVSILTKETVITDVEKPCFHALLIQYHGYRLLLLAYAVLQIFVSPELDMTTRLNRLRETTWGRQVIISAGTVLIEFVRFGEQPYASSLSHTPDHLFNLVCFAALLLIKTRHLYGTSQPYPLPTLPPLVGRVTEFFKKLALTEDHLPMRCAMLIETLMKAYERIRAGSPRETETPSTNDDRTRGQPGPSSRPPASTSTSIVATTTTYTGSRASTAGKDCTDANLLEPNSAHGSGFDGMTNLDQMGGIEMFFSQSLWPESVLSGLAGESDGEGVALFDFGNLFGLFDTQPQF